MSDNEERRNEAVDRLGGTSRLARLEQRIQHLEGLLQEVHLRPGVVLTRLDGSTLSWNSGTTQYAIPPAQATLEAIGEDWCVVRCAATGEVYLAIEPNIHFHLRTCL